MAKVRRPAGVSCRGGGAALIVRVDSHSRGRGRAGDVRNPAAGTVQLGGLSTQA